MVSIEELRESITTQLELFNDRLVAKHERALKQLQEENRVLRGQVVASLGPGTYPEPVHEGPEKPVKEKHGAENGFGPRIVGTEVVRAVFSNPIRVQTEVKAEEPCDFEEAAPAQETTDDSGSEVVRFESEIKFCSVSQVNDEDLDGIESRVTPAVRNWTRMLTDVLSWTLFGFQRAKLESTLALRPAWEAIGAQGRIALKDAIIDKDSFNHTESMGRFVSISSEISGLDAGRSSQTQIRKCTSVDRSCIRYMIFHPESKVITPWVLWSAFVILYDVITFPIAGFDVPDTKASEWIMWFTSIFWTLDIFITCIRGVHVRGVVEMRPSVILMLYAKTWLAMDLIMVLTDWVFIYFTTGSQSSVTGASKVLRSGKALRAARVLRALRLIRTVKIFQTIREAVENMRSEYIALMIKLGFSILIILVMSHYVTCSWFAQAYFNEDDSTTWITVFLSKDPRLGLYTEYATSMHFALTQLAGSQDIVPQNSRERVVASVIIVFDIVVFSSLVGVITDIMAQFRYLTFERSKEITLIKKFFHRVDIKPTLENRIWRFFRKHYRQKMSIVHERDIDFFKGLPSSLKMLLHEHLYVPVISTHPLMRCILESDRHTLLALCAEAVSSESPAAESEVFTDGDQATKMFFVTAGSFSYRSRTFQIETIVRPTTWISEVVLWTSWLHCGQFIALEVCDVLRVDAERFEMTILERAYIEWARSLKKYAALYAQRVSDSFDSPYPITDLDLNRDRSLEDITRSAFPQHFPNSPAYYSSEQATAEVDVSEHRTKWRSIMMKTQSHGSRIDLAAMEHIGSNQQSSAPRKTSGLTALRQSVKTIATSHSRLTSRSRNSKESNSSKESKNSA